MRSLKTLGGFDLGRRGGQGAKARVQTKAQLRYHGNSHVLNS